MVNCNPISIPMETGAKVSKFDGGERVDTSRYRSLVGSLRYITSTRSNLSLSVNIISQFMEESVYSHWKALKWVLRYIQGIVSLGVFYSKAKDYKLVGYSDSDWCRDIDDRKKYIEICFLYGQHNIYLAFKKATDRDAINVWSWICDSILVCMSCDMA